MTIQASVAMRDEGTASDLHADAATTIEIGRRVLAEEAAALHQMAAGLGQDFVDAVELLHSCRGRVVLTGVGKSGHVGRKIAATLASTGRPAHFVHANEASHGDLGMIEGVDVVVAVSRSGETQELADILEYVTRFDIRLIAMTAFRDSTLGKAADVCLQLPDLPEATAEVSAPTTSTTLQIALGDALSVALLERRGFRPQDFRIFHPGGKIGSVLLTAADLMHTHPDLPLLHGGVSMSEAILVMSEKRFGCVGVVDDSERLVGIITDGDLRRHMAGLLDHTTEQVMTHNPRCIDPHMLAGEALRVMTESERPITTLFVAGPDRRPIGILHIHDLLRAGVA